MPLPPATHTRRSSSAVTNKSNKFFNQICRGLLVSGRLGVIIVALLLICTNAISRWTFVDDGKVVEYNASTRSPQTSSTQIFLIHSNINNSADKKFAQRLSQQINHPITMINNGSACGSDQNQCLNLGDYSKAFLNRFGNRVTGRGNEPIISSTKRAIAKTLQNPKIKELVIVTYSEGGLIAQTALEDLIKQQQPYIEKITVVFLGTPVNWRKLQKLSYFTGAVISITNAQDPVFCLQEDVWSWQNLSDQNSLFRKCLVQTDFSYHYDKIYFQPLIERMSYLDPIRKTY